jgi:hypothetical protein
MDIRSFAEVFSLGLGRVTFPSGLNGMTLTLLGMGIFD